MKNNCTGNKSYLQNLLFEALPSTQDNFEKVYIDHLQLIVDIAFSNKEKIAAVSYWGGIKGYTSINEIKSIINIVVENKDVIFNGLAHSNLMKQIKSDYSKIGMKKSTIDNLIKAEFYHKEDILNFNSSDFIHILNERIPKDQVGKTYEDTVKCLNRAGYDTSKLGFPGNRSGNKHLSEKEFKHILSESKEPSKKENNSMVEINCPHCGKRIRVAISKV